MIPIVVAALAISLLVVTMLAASVHFITGPVAVDAGTQLVVAGKLSGLGEGTITILVNADGIADVECTNPGGNVAPGQDTTVDATGSLTLPVTKNGTVTFSVATVAPSIPSTPTCPNTSWSAAALDVAFTNAVLTVFQGGVIVLQQGL
jgi:hypothetical protein